MVGLRLGAAEIAPCSSRGVREEDVVELIGWLEHGGRGSDVVAAPPPPPLVPTSPVTGVAGSPGKSTDWIRRQNMAAGFTGPFGPFSSPLKSSEIALQSHRVTY